MSFKERKNIGMVLDGAYPGDIRVRKEAVSLSSDYNVFVLCVGIDKKVDVEKIDGVTVIRAIHYKNYFCKGWADIQTALYFKHPVFERVLPSFVKKYKINVLHVHDLPLANTVYRVARKNKIKWILDMHENYPEAMNVWFLWRKNIFVRLKNKLFFSYKRWSLYESYILPKADHIIAVIDEMKSLLVKKKGVPLSKITVVTNSETKEFARLFNQKSITVLDKVKDKFIISYVGGIGPHRGLQIAIEAMKKITRVIPSAHLAIIGPSHIDVQEHLKSLIKNHGVGNVVELYGRQSLSDLAYIMSISSINIIPHISNEHTESTIPHKLFQILISGRPLLVSNCAPLKRVVTKEDIGYVFESGNALDFAKKVICIYKNPREAKEKAKRGKQLALNGDLSWRVTAKALLNLYKKLDF